MNETKGNNVVTSSEQSRPKKKKSKEKKVREKKVNITNPSVKAWRSMHDAVRNALVHCEPGSELDVLLQTLLHDHPIDRVKEDVLTGFQTYYTTTFRSDQVHVFGSTVMGITFEDSDLDFYVELPDCDRVKPRTRRIKIARQILESTKQFTNFQSITAPRVPILKCTHIATRTNIDLNCSNQYGSLNSPIIAHLLRFDRRIHQLAIIIKYWMKIHDCSGSNRISHYSVILMLIFYLQTLPEPIVPPIVEFQRNVPPIMVDNYNFAFDYSLPNRTANRSEWPELLLGFFNFYQDFDYSSLLISPLYGKTYFKTDVKRKNVQNLQRCEEMLSADRSEQPIHLGKGTLCIQDPFEIDREISAGVFFKVLQNFIWKLGYAVEIIEGELPKGVTKSMFLQIFDVAAFNKDLDRMRPQQKQQKPKASKGNAEQKLSSLDVDAHHILKGKLDEHNIASVSFSSKNTENGTASVQLKPTNFILTTGQSMLMKVVASIENIETNKLALQQFWAEEVIAMIIDILSNIYMLDIYDKKSEKFAKNFDMVGAFDLINGRKRIKSIKADTWNKENRKSSKRFNGETNYVPLQISTEIVADVKNFDFVSIEFNDDIKTKRSNFFNCFCGHFLDHINYFLKVYFVHRYERELKAGEAKANLSNATEDSTAGRNAEPELEVKQQKIETVRKPHIAPTDSQNANHSTTLRVMPTESMLFVIRDRHDKCNVASANKHSVRQLWVAEVINMIADILVDIFKLQLSKETINDHQCVFHLTGLRDKSNKIFLGRKFKESKNDTWTKELLESTNRFRKKSIQGVPLKLSAKITANAENFDYVSIELRDEIKTKRQNFFEAFRQDFIGRIVYFLDIYFIHRYKMAESVDVNSSNSKQCIESAASASTLTMALTRREREIRSD